MRFFDYKFLILLGLTLVVYFIYREIEHLREKVHKLETDIINNNKLLESINNTKPLLTEKNNNSTEKNNTPKVSPKIISIDLMSTTADANLTNVKQNISPLVSAPINAKLSEYDSESDTTTSISESSKHLAIYSNDNEQFEEVQNSLMESVEANKNNLTFDYDEIENSNFKNTIEAIMNNLSSEADDGHKSPIDEIIEEKEKQLSEMSKTNSPVQNKNVGNEEENKSVSKEEENKSVSKEEVNRNSACEKEEMKKESNGLDNQTLNNMKLPEIKKLAEQYKITISKKINGQQKLKNKTELITEILNKLKN